MKLTINEKIMISDLLTIINNCMERDDLEDIKSDNAYVANSDNFIFAMSEKEYKIFKKLLLKI